MRADTPYKITDRFTDNGLKDALKMILRNTGDPRKFRNIKILAIAAMHVINDAIDTRFVFTLQNIAGGYTHCAPSPSTTIFFVVFAKLPETP